MSLSNLVDDRAELGSEEEDEDFDEENGEATSRRNGANGGIDDSSDDEDDDDDEAEAAAIREGFIVDEDEDEDEERTRRRREHRKRRRAEREEEEAALDEEDLDLIGEANPELEQRQQAKSKFKRLKRGPHRDERGPSGPRAVDEIFSEDDDHEEVVEPRGQQDEFADFIEEDEFEDDVQRALEEEREVARPGRAVKSVAGIHEAGLDETSIEDMRLAFGDGTEYDWALAKQEEQDFIAEGGDKQLELKDVFEPSQLIEKMLTDEDDLIRAKDVPERLQLARKPFLDRDGLSDEAKAVWMKEESQWVADMLWPKKKLDREFHEPFKASVRHVVELMNLENFEVPYIFQHRKDYLISTGASDDPQSPGANNGPQRLLGQDDLWEIADLDLRFRGLLEKREALQATYEGLKKSLLVEDKVFESMINEAVSSEEMQDMQDYLHFQYSAQIKDLSVIQTETNGTQKRAQNLKSTFENIRGSRVYNFVRSGFGITADALASNLLENAPRIYTEDSTSFPDDLADQNIDAPEYPTGSMVQRAGKAMFIEEISISPRMRKFMRGAFYQTCLIDVQRTDKGLRKITEDHPYYPLKYLRGQTFQEMAKNPDRYLRMLKAESEGLVEVRFQLSNRRAILEKLYGYIESDSVSAVADAWNLLRKEVVETAVSRLEKIITKGVRETLKIECENSLARICRERYGEKLDQAPYKPRGMVAGTVPRVLALSNGRGLPGKDAICWAFVDDDGRVVENGKFVDLRLGNQEKFLPDGKDVVSLIEVIKRRQPDVIAVSGFSVETRKLYKDLQEVVDRNGLQRPDEEADEGGDSDRLEVVMVNDEVARLYHTSDRAAKDHPQLPPLTRYCVALAKYLQSPLKEYASLGKNITSISFDPNQSLLPPEKLHRHLESAMVDIVNLVGVDINAAVEDPYVGALLPYVCGLGPRKANSMIKATQMNGTFVSTREALLGTWDENEQPTSIPATTAVVWANCASFLFIDFDATEPESDYLDSTRVHPEDYGIARKMAADALELDEEDVKQEVDEGGKSAVIRRMVREKAEDKVNDLVLEEYAVQLEQHFKQRKRATLETIRAELQNPYEELRRNFALLSSDDICTMLTGETKDSLADGMIVPVVIRRIFPDHIEVKLDCGIEGGVSEAEYPDGVGGERGIEPRQAFTVNATVQAKITFINRKHLSATLSLREDSLRRGYIKDSQLEPSKWDYSQEGADKKSAEKEREDVSGRAQRVVNHPLFFSYNAMQAEEYLGSKEPGEVVIRPSSKGLDHLAITWKIADSIYQHIDVLELDKENQFSLGKTLKVGGKYTYSDLDELIVNHVESMAKKVTEIMRDDRYQKGSRAQTESWLKTYCEANPKRSMYAFYTDPRYPGYFRIAFKAGLNANIGSWPIKVIPNAFEMRGHQYPDMNALKNGFKLLFTGDAGRRR